MALEFDDDILFAEENSVGYRNIFVLEQWLRRIAYTALMARVGPNVLGGIPSALVQELKARVASLPGRMHLGAETSGEHLWMTTIDELRGLMVSNSLFPIVRELTEFHRPVLGEKLSELREIRNVIGHNRTISAKTIAILKADLLSLEDGIQKFRHEMLRDRSWTESPLQADIGHEIEQYWVNRVEEEQISIPPEAVQLVESRYFYFALVVPRQRRAFGSDSERDLGAWVHGQTALEHLAKVWAVILAVVLPVRGGSLSIIWPKQAAPAQHFSVIDAFLGSLQVIWGDEEYSVQDARFICNPKFWFATRGYR